MTTERYIEEIKKIYGKTIAIVYIFEAESAKGFKHYDVWKSDVISAWLMAIQELRCIPYIIDVATFIYKAMDRTLPKIDYVINLNAGNKNLSVAGLVPSVCAFLEIPCIPCDSVTTLLGEHKRFSNYIAKEVGILIPEEAPKDKVITNKFINRPINFGSSEGVYVSSTNSNSNENILCQEFINGFDVTTPILFNPLKEQLDTLPSIMYMPNSNDFSWFLGAEAKSKHSGYVKQNINLDKNAKKLLVDVAKKFNIKTFCRIDCRIKCDNTQKLQQYQSCGITPDEIYFMEINPTPTIKEGINFLNSFEHIHKHSEWHNVLIAYKSIIKTTTYVGFILANSIMQLSTAMHYE